MKKLILASSSPRRQALLQQVGFSFDVITEDFDENTCLDDPADIVKEIAVRKASIICKKYHVKAIVLAADTIVWHQGRKFGKPADSNEAFAMLNSLQGKTHHVYTGVCAIDSTGKTKAVKCFVDSAEVRMRRSSEEEILAYIGTGEPFGKAGAYAVQEKGAFLVEKIVGDFYTVVGLPLIKVCICLRELGLEITSQW